MKTLSGIFAFFLFSCTALLAQVTVTVNGEKISNNQTIKYSDLKTMTASFSNAQKIADYKDVILHFYLKLKNSDNSTKYFFCIRKEGWAPVSDFMKTAVGKEHKIFPCDKDCQIITANGNSIDYLIDWVSNMSSCVSLQAEMGLSYSEVLKRNIYDGTVLKTSEDVALAEKVVFEIDLLDANGMMTFKKLNAKLPWDAKAKETGYVDLDNKETAAGETPSGEYLPVLKFDKFYLNAYRFSGDIEAFKKGFDTYARLSANICYDKIAQKYLTEESKDQRAWGSLTGMGNTNFFEKLDEKEYKKEAEAQQLWVPVSAGSLTGVKWSGMLSYRDCNASSSSGGGLLGGIASAFSKPKVESTPGGYSVVYLFKHPKQSGKLLAFSIISGRKDATEEEMKNAMTTAEKFLSLLVFQ